MAGVLLDTHAAIWYLARSPRLSATARRAILAASAAAAPIYVPTIALVEIRYLVERGRLPEAAWQALDQALADPDVALVAAPLSHDTARAVREIPRDDVPDMPDRIIAATALALGVP